MLAVAGWQMGVRMGLMRFFDKRIPRVGVLSLLLLLPSPVFSAPVEKGLPKSTAVVSVKIDLVAGGHLFKHYCAVCHGTSGKGNGLNAGNLDPHPADLTGEEVASLTNAEIYEVIEKGGAAVELSAAMPPWGKTLSREQIQNVAAYVRALSSGDEVKKVRASDLKEPGKTDCRVCHIKNVVEQIAPNLGHEGTKLKADWLYRFLKNPTRLRPVGFIPLTKTRMPNFYFGDEDASALTAYLMTQKDAGISTASTAGFNLSDPLEVEKGRSLFVDKYACDACHKTGEKTGGIVGPDLAEASNRLRPEWIFHWLKNPQLIRPDSPMPTLGIPDAEIRSLVAYVLGVGKKVDPVVAAGVPVSDTLVEKGGKLIKEKNCLFCHTLDAYNSQTGKGDK